MDVKSATVARAEITSLASNVLSLPKLREKYDQLRLNAQKSTPKQQPVNDDPYFYLNKPRGGSDA